MGGEREMKHRKEGVERQRILVALRRNRPSGLGVDTWTHFIIDGALKSSV